MVKKQEHEISLTSFQIQDSFWSYFQNLVKDVVIPYQEQILNDELPDVEKAMRSKTSGSRQENLTGSTMEWYSRTATWPNGWKPSLTL